MEKIRRLSASGGVSLSQRPLGWIRDLHGQYLWLDVPQIQTPGQPVFAPLRVLLGCVCMCVRCALPSFLLLSQPKPNSQLLII